MLKGTLGSFPIFHAVQRQFASVVDLLKNSIQAKNSLGQNVMHCCAISGYLNMTKQILKLGGRLDIQDLDGNTPLHYAVKSNNLHLIRLLLLEGADSKLLNHNGESPLKLAKKQKLVDALPLLKNENDSPLTLNDLTEFPLPILAQKTSRNCRSPLFIQDT